MRKILLSLLILLLLIYSILFMVNGLSSFNLNGFMDLRQKDSELNEKISDLSNSINVTYEDALFKLKTTANTLTKNKTDYENQAALSSTQESSYIAQKEKYDIEYLWTKLGNYAMDENCTLKIDVSETGGANKNLYNLKFNVSGSYSSITDFIYDIENDSKLGFLIDNFTMSSSGGVISSTFECRDIPISVVKVEGNEKQKNTEEKEEENSDEQAKEENSSEEQGKEGNS